MECGIGNDCDDFAVATCSLVTSILGNSHGMSPVSQWVVDNVTKAYCVSGVAWPRKKLGASGAPITCGHMWCELMLKDGSMMVVECTSAVAYYGGNVVCGNARVGSLEEYVERRFYLDAHHGYTAKPVYNVDQSRSISRSGSGSGSGADNDYSTRSRTIRTLPTDPMVKFVPGDKLQTSVLPDWVSSLRFTSPSVSNDTEFVDPGHPPKLRPITGFDVHRDKVAGSVRILPFTKAFVVWHFKGFTKRTSTFGSYQ